MGLLKLLRERKEARSGMGGYMSLTAFIDA